MLVQPVMGRAELDVARMPCIAARWIDVGVCAPQYFHAAYEALALAQAANAEPIVLWGQPGAHVSIGCTQDRDAEIVPSVSVPVLRRALGGGAVWIDEGQYCVVLIASNSMTKRSRETFSDLALDAVAATMRAFGLAATRCERDVWVGDKKIAGSGSATIGDSMAIGSSFLMRFAPERFAQTIRLAHEGLRSWLIDALALTLTDWAHEAALPYPQELAAAFRHALGEHLGWEPRASSITEAEQALIVEVQAEINDDWIYHTPRRVPDGVRLNARSYLCSRLGAQGYEDRLVLNGHTVRVGVHGRTEH